MSVVLALTVALILIALGLLRENKARRADSPVLVRRYFHPGHSWLRVTEDGDVTVGLDEFGQSVIGTIDCVELPRTLHKVHQGDVACHVWHGDRRVPLVSPVTGRVVMKNDMVLNNPTLVNTSPYSDGWLFRVKPQRLVPQMRNLFIGRSAQRWQDEARAHLARLFSGVPALMYQDGGVLIHNLADRCSDDEWYRVVHEVFLAEESHETQPKEMTQ